MDTEYLREWMINHQIRPWNVLNERVLEVLGEVKREHFVPDEFRALAFADTEIPLPCGQSMLKPLIEGRLLDALQPEEHHEALLIGTGSGYVTACLAHLTGRVTALDLHDELTARARDVLGSERLHNVELLTTDYQDYVPDTGFDRILVTGSMPLFDAQLVERLKPNGRLVLTVGQAPSMTVEAVTRTENHFVRERLFETVLPVLENVPGLPQFRF